MDMDVVENNWRNGDNGYIFSNIKKNTIFSSFYKYK